MEKYIENQWCCYILKSLNIAYQNKTYVGSTNCVKRRIRQHNREISGGAKATGIGMPHEFYCVISGFKNRKAALRCEWLLKHPGKKNQYKGVIGRIKGLNVLLKTDKWIERSENSKLTIYIKRNYDDLIDADVNMVIF